MLALDVGLRGIRRADDNQELRRVQFFLHLFAQIAKREIDGVAEHGPYLDVLADLLASDRRQTVVLQLALQPLRLALISVVVADERILTVFLLQSAHSRLVSKTHSNT